MKTWILIFLMHGSATFDAWSTNLRLNQQPLGWGVYEINPVLRPFAGSKKMYLATNLAVVPIDVWLLKRPRSKKAKWLAMGTIGWTSTLGWRNWRLHKNDWREYERRQRAETFLRQTRGFNLDLDPGGGLDFAVDLRQR